MESGSKLVIQSGTSGNHLAEFNYKKGRTLLQWNQKFATHSNGVITSGRLFINSTNAGFDYNTIADTFEILTTNGSVHSEFTSGAFLSC